MLTDEQLKMAQDAIDSVGSDYKSLMDSAGMDYKKATAAMKAKWKEYGKMREQVAESSGVNAAQAKAQKALADFAAVNKLVSNRNTLNVEQRAPRKSHQRHGRTRLRVLDHMVKRIEYLENIIYDGNPDDAGGFKARVTEVHELQLVDLDKHIMNLNVKKVLQAAAQTSASGIKFIMVRAFSPHCHFWGEPDETTNSPLASDNDRKRTKCQPSFYGIVSDGAMPSVGDIVNVEFPDKTDLSCGLYMGVFVSLPAVRKPFNAKSSFNGAGSSPLHQYSDGNRDLDGDGDDDVVEAGEN